MNEKIKQTCFTKFSRRGGGLCTSRTYSSRYQCNGIGTYPFSFMIRQFCVKVALRLLPATECSAQHRASHAGLHGCEDTDSLMMPSTSVNKSAVQVVVLVGPSRAHSLNSSSMRLYFNQFQRPYSAFANASLIESCPNIQRGCQSLTY